MCQKNPPILVSACLAGFNTRYNGKVKPNQKCQQSLDKLPPNLAGAAWFPACPEQLGGLPTPREAADIVGGDGHDVLDGKAKVITKSGEDVTEQFVHGAEQVLQLVKRLDCREAWLKARSPSCAVYGSPGVTAALLLRHGIKLVEY